MLIQKNMAGNTVLHICSISNMEEIAKDMCASLFIGTLQC